MHYWRLQPFCVEPPSTITDVRKLGSDRRDGLLNPNLNIAPGREYNIGRHLERSAFALNPVLQAALLPRSRRRRRKNLLYGCRQFYRRCAGSSVLRH